MLRYGRPPQFDDEEEELEVKPSFFIRLFGAVILIAFVALAYNLYQIQVVQGTELKRAADENRIRLVRTDAARGVIYDANGNVIVRNEPQFNVSIVPADLPTDKQDEILKTLSVLIDAPLDTSIEAETTDPIGSIPSDASRTFISPTRRPGLRELVNEGRRTDPLNPVLVKTNIPRVIAFQLQERTIDFPGVRVEIAPVRTYPEKDLASHILGYLGAISPEAFSDYEKRGYDQNDLVGVIGLEAAYEDQLRGRAGTDLAIVDASGNIIRSTQQDAPIPGNNLILSLDMDLQQKVEEALKKGLEKKKLKQGVAIVMNPNNGEILSMVSLPTYDNNLFARGIKPTDFSALNQDKDRPLVNHAISGLYPPGSVYKLTSAAGALQEGVIDSRNTIFCSGIMYLPNRFFPDDPKLAQPFYCWYRQGHGPLNIVDGIAQSSDIFFYKLDGGFTDFTTPLGQALSAEYMRLFGYGTASGIDLPGEADGLVPDPKWKQRNLNEQWTTGDTYNMAIGQGFVLATPLQVLNTTATIANGGTLYRPHFARAIVNASGTVTNTIEPQIVRKVPIDSQNLELVREGMRAAVSRGTAWKANLQDVEVAGKTGTAEFFGPKKGGRLPTHAWFTAYAPYDKPEVAVVVFVYDGGEGSEVAAPIATDILRAYFHLPADAPLIDRTNPPPPETGTTAPNAGAGAAPPQLQTQANYTGSVAEVTDNSANENPSIVGSVTNSAGQGVGGITVVLDTGDGKVVASAVTAGDGSFRFENVNYKASPRWFLRLSGGASSTAVAVDVSAFKQYRIQFSAAP
ncbi:MAG: penicillin-binding protein 2 [Chloroflexota bacterium]|nr:MAG: penicillin-binding protein 2 [Chloroflexota bacterium]